MQAFAYRQGCNIEFYLQDLLGRPHRTEPLTAAQTSELYVSAIQAVARGGAHYRTTEATPAWDRVDKRPVWKPAETLSQVKAIYGNRKTLLEREIVGNLDPNETIHLNATKSFCAAFEAEDFAALDAMHASGDVARLLGASVTSGAPDWLFRAVTHGSNRLFDWLLEHGFEFLRYDVDGATRAHLGSERLAVLLASLVDHNAFNRFLHVLRVREFSIVEWLLLPLGVASGTLANDAVIDEIERLDAFALLYEPCVAATAESSIDHSEHEQPPADAAAEAAAAPSPAPPSPQLDDNMSEEIAALIVSAAERAKTKRARAAPLVKIIESDDDEDESDEQLSEFRADSETASPKARRKRRAKTAKVAAMAEPHDSTRRNEYVDDGFVVFDYDAAEDSPASSDVTSDTSQESPTHKADAREPSMDADRRLACVQSVKQRHRRKTSRFQTRAWKK